MGCWAQVHAFSKVIWPGKCGEDSQRMVLLGQSLYWIPGELEGMRVCFLHVRGDVSAAEESPRPPITTHICSRS